MIFPIHIDVTSRDKSVRIIDTILIDPTCLPIAPSATAAHADIQTFSCSTNLQTTTITRNVGYLAHTLLADMEVHSSAKAGKTGRVLLLSKPNLMQQVEEQIHRQLKLIMDKEQVKGKKRKLEDIEKPSTIVTQSSGGNLEESKDEESKDNLIPIKIRIRENGICVADEFKVDPNDPITNPIILAESMVKDLNLPEQMSNSIAISIAEQMCGLDVPHDVTGWTMTEQVASPNNPALLPTTKRIPVNRAVPTAWKVESKEENSFMQHAIDIGKPT